MPPCLARFSKVWLRLGDGKHRFLTEDLCGHVCEVGQTRCSSCLAKKQIKTQDARTFDHGLINGDFTKESHMFDSPWFHAAIEKYGAPKAEDLQLAMETQRKARAAVGVSVSVQVEPTPALTPPAAPVQIAPVKLKKTTTKKPAEKKAAAEKKPPAEKKGAADKKPRAKKQEVIVVPATPTVKAVEVIPPTATHVETTDEPLQVSDVIQVILRPFTHNSVRFWRDGLRDKVYKRMPDGKRGPYTGRWDSETQEINKEAPDSDEE